MDSFIGLKPNHSFINNNVSDLAPKTRDDSLSTAESTGDSSNSSMNIKKLTVNGEISLVIESTSDPEEDLIGSFNNEKMIKSTNEDHQLNHIVNFDIKSNHNDTVNRFLTSDSLIISTNFHSNQTSELNVKPFLSFEEMGISKQVLDGIKLFIDQPNKFQQEILPILLDKNLKRDLFIKSWPNCGKKTSYLLSAVERIDPQINKTQFIVVLPNAEAVIYSSEFAREIAKHKKIKIKFVIRNDEPKSNEKVDEHLVIATAGSLIHILTRLRIIDTGELKGFIIDTAELIFGSDEYVARIKRLCGLLRNAHYQIYSSSFGDKFKSFVCETISIDPIILDHLNLGLFNQYFQFFVRVNYMDKISKLMQIVTNSLLDKILIFTAKPQRSQEVYDNLVAIGLQEVIVISSNSTVEQRLYGVHRFNFLPKSILILNYPISQGIELIGNLLVVNYDLPRPANYLYTEYLHKISRCSNANRSSINYVINLVSRDFEDSMINLEKFFNFKMIEMKI